jgi:hypothetical protein
MYQNTFIRKITRHELQKLNYVLQIHLVEYWVLSVWLWMNCSLSVSISIA